MALYPVIMCGGAGMRLWPASRPSRPKQFIPLSGNRSLFQESVLRVAPLADDGGRLVVVGGVTHRDLILDQLSEVGVTAKVLLEPQARDSAPAMAAAATWVRSKDPAGVLAFVTSDHHIPDHDAFRQAVGRAAKAARQGRIVTLGIPPTEASPAYGYIRAGEGDPAVVQAFVEKPDAATAAAYVEAGYLWNSGNFIVQAKILDDELKRHAANLVEAVIAATPEDDDSDVVVLGDAFREAPRISIDYAVMERTDRASVLKTSFDWSDLGAWDAMASSGEGDLGVHILEDAEGCLVRAPDGVLVAALGVRNIAVVAERDAILVCDLARAQDVKRLVGRVAAASPQHLDFPDEALETLADASRRFADWMRVKALPVWSTLGLRTDGGFVEALSLDGRAAPATRRTRVQARQIYVYAQAGRLGWAGPWRSAVRHGTALLRAAYRRPDGFYRASLTPEGAPLEETAYLYDQAFVLLALASAEAAGEGDGDHAQAASALRDRLNQTALADGMWKEAGSHPFQANAHMHLLEACMAWEEAGGDSGWAEISDRIVGLARSRFIDPAGGYLLEFYDQMWRPAAGEDGRLVEPGHQFEWSWLLTRWGKLRGDSTIMSEARTLYQTGQKGLRGRPPLALDALNSDFSTRSSRSRLWPQTEWLKAALALSGDPASDRGRMFDDAADAVRALWLYLTPEGLWRDKHLGGGRFLDELAPASSFYHIMAAFSQLSETASSAGVKGLGDLHLR